MIQRGHRRGADQDSSKELNMGKRGVLNKKPEKVEKGREKRNLQHSFYGPMAKSEKSQRKPKKICPNRLLEEEENGGGEGVRKTSLVFRRGQQSSGVEKKA